MSTDVLGLEAVSQIQFLQQIGDLMEIEPCISMKGIAGLFFFFPDRVSL